MIEEWDFLWRVRLAPLCRSISESQSVLTAGDTIERKDKDILITPPTDSKKMICTKVRRFLISRTRRISLRSGAWTFLGGLGVGGGGGVYQLAVQHQHQNIPVEKTSKRVASV